MGRILHGHFHGICTSTHCAQRLDTRLDFLRTLEDLRVIALAHPEIFVVLAGVTHRIAVPIRQQLIARGVDTLDDQPQLQSAE